MPRREPTVTKTLKASEAREQFSQILNEVFRGESRILVEKSGIPVAGIVSAQDLERFNQWEAQREKDFAILDEIGEAFKDIPAEEIERHVSQALASARKELRKTSRRATPES